MTEICETIPNKQEVLMNILIQSKKIKKYHWKSCAFGQKWDNFSKFLINNGKFFIKSHGKLTYSQIEISPIVYSPGR